MRKRLKMNKKGQLGMGIAKTFLLGLMTLVIIGVTTLIVLNSLGDTSVVEDDVGTSAVINNSTNAIGDFFSNAGTWLALLGVVIIILIISVVISVVNKFGGGGSSV